MPNAVAAPVREMSGPAGGKAAGRPIGPFEGAAKLVQRAPRRNLELGGDGWAEVSDVHWGLDIYDVIYE